MIPLFDFYLEPKLLKKIHKKIFSVINSKSYILGNELLKFESAFARFAGVKYAVGVASGTDALRLSLRSLGIGLGDKVLTVAFTSPFTVLAIVQEGAIPVFCDVDSETMTIDVDDASRKIDAHVRAIIPVHLYGNPCDMDSINTLAKKKGLRIIEDACQAHGAIYKNKHVGNFGSAGAFSFYPTKNLGAMGDAGMVITNDPKVANKIRVLRHGGQTRRFWHKYAGYNSRLDEIQAAVLSLKLKSLKTENRKRLELSKRYKKFLSDLPIGFQKVHRGANSSNHLFVIRTKKRDQLKNYLFGKRIVTDIYYPYPVHAQEAFRKFGSFKLPATERLSKEILALPLFPSLSFSSQDLVIENIRRFFREK